MDRYTQLHQQLHQHHPHLLRSPYPTPKLPPLHSHPMPQPQPQPHTPPAPQHARSSSLIPRGQKKGATLSSPASSPHLSTSSSASTPSQPASPSYLAMAAGFQDAGQKSVRGPFGEPLPTRQKSQPEFERQTGELQRNRTLRRARKSSHDLGAKFKMGLKTWFKRDKVDGETVDRIEDRHWSD